MYGRVRERISSAEHEDKVVNKKATVKLQQMPVPTATLLSRSIEAVPEILVNTSWNLRGYNNWMTRISFQDNEEGMTSLFPSFIGTGHAVIICESTFSAFSGLWLTIKKKSQTCEFLPTKNWSKSRAMSQQVINQPVNNCWKPELY